VRETPKVPQYIGSTRCQAPYWDQKTHASLLMATDSGKWKFGGLKHEQALRLCAFEYRRTTEEDSKSPGGSVFKTR